MAADDLTGNMPTEKMKAWFDENDIETGINEQRFNESMLKAQSVFP